MNTENKVYRRILEHRRLCPLWGKGFCLECFGGGLSKFLDDYDDEERRDIGLPTITEHVRAYLDYEAKMKAIRSKHTFKHGSQA